MWTGLVFAGGRSERMGRDKALVPLAGRTLLERAVATLREAGGAPLVLGPPRETPGVAGVRFVDEEAEGGKRLGPSPPRAPDGARAAPGWAWPRPARVRSTPPAS